MAFGISNMRSRWAFVSGACVGVLVALPLAAPLWDGKLLEPVATLWGNALGAIGAVTAAIWAADRGSSQQRRQAAALIYAMIQPIAMHCNELTRAYRLLPIQSPDNDAQESEPVQADTWKVIQDLNSKTMLSYYAFENNIQRIDSILSYLDPQEIQVFLELEIDLKLICRGTLDQIARETDRTELKMYGGYAYGTRKKELSDLNDRIQPNTAIFRKAAR